MGTSVIHAALRRAQEQETISLSDLADPVAIATFAVPPAYLVKAIRSTDDTERARVRQLLQHSGSPSSLLANRFVRWLLHKNQFLPVDLGVHRRARDIYDRGFFEAIQLAERATAQDVMALLDDHGGALRSLIADVAGAYPRDVVSAEYTPTTQLTVLGLSLDLIRGPVLDIGSGEHAQLVQHMRSAGLHARGIDRLGRGEMRGDWLTFDPGHERWATITAHHSFTLHFHHHHYNPRSADASVAYAEAFMRYLFALEVGGTFAYAPALPFFERILPADRWSVRPRSTILDGVSTTATQIIRRY